MKAVILKDTIKHNKEAQFTSTGVFVRYIESVDFNVRFPDLNNLVLGCSTSYPITEKIATAAIKKLYDRLKTAETLGTEKSDRADAIRVDLSMTTKDLEVDIDDVVDMTPYEEPERP